MGYAECKVTMESRTGSVSSGRGSSCGVRGQTLQSSPFCPRSSSKLTQSIIKDHMMSHYKKVYSAKAAIDNSVPKSMLQSVKYNDQIRQEQLRKGGRPQSAHSFLQRSSRRSCSSIQSRSSGQYDESPYLCSSSSIISSTKVTTSFNHKDTVYPSCKVSSNHPRSASEMKYRSPGAALQRKQSACSLAALRDQSCYKSFQDPVQKTYSGDLLQKHSQNFTQDKPFTPKTLKSDKSSYLSKYRYYRAPRRKPTQDCGSSILMRQETYHGSTITKEDTQELEPSQEYSTEHVLSDDEVNGTYLSPSRQQSRITKRKKHLFGSSSRVLSEDGESPIMRRVTAEEEELMYLEFISAVTEDILSKGHLSERVLNRVMKRHIDMNLHQLDEDKMGHLLEVLRKELEKPTNIPASDKEPDIKDNSLLDTIFSHLQSGDKRGETKEDNDSFSCVSLISNNLPDYPDPFLVSMPVCSPERTTSGSVNEKDKESDNEEKSLDSLLLTENVLNNAGNSQSDFHQGGTTTTKDIYNDDHKHTTTNRDTVTDQAGIQFDGQSKELEDLGRSLSEMLHVSSNTHSDNTEAATGQRVNTVASVSDDEF